MIEFPGPKAFLYLGMMQCKSSPPLVVFTFLERNGPQRTYAFVNRRAYYRSAGTHLTITNNIDDTASKTATQRPSTTPRVMTAAWSGPGTWAMFSMVNVISCPNTIFSCSSIFSLWFSSSLRVTRALAVTSSPCRLGRSRHHAGRGLTLTAPYLLTCSEGTMFCLESLAMKPTFVATSDRCLMLPAAQMVMTVTLMSRTCSSDLRHTPHRYRSSQQNDWQLIQLTLDWLRDRSYFSSCGAFLSTVLAASAMEMTTMSLVELLSTVTCVNHTKQSLDIHAHLFSRWLRHFFFKEPYQFGIKMSHFVRSRGHFDEKISFIKSKLLLSLHY